MPKIKVAILTPVCNMLSKVKLQGKLLGSQTPASQVVPEGHGPVGVAISLGSGPLYGAGSAAFAAGVAIKIKKARKQENKKTIYLKDCPLP